MTALLLTPTVLSLLLLAAHWSRAGLMPLVVVTLVFVALVFVRRRWSSLVLQGVLLLGAAEWVRTIFELVAARQAMGMPAGRLVAILSAVVLVALLAVFAHRTPRLQGHFRRGPN